MKSLKCTDFVSFFFSFSVDLSVSTLLKQLETQEQFTKFDLYRF